MTALQQKLERLKQDNPSIDIEHIMNVLSNYSPNKWVKPTNGTNIVNYDVFEELHSYHLVRKMITPIYNRDGNFVGNEVEFWFSMLLNYSKQF